MMWVVIVNVIFEDLVLSCKFFLQDLLCIFCRQIVSPAVKRTFPMHALVTII